jgi:Holliday junction DNA helicase RuvA
LIASVNGILAEREAEAVVIQTEGGLGYEIAVPLGVFERLPARGSRCTLHTELVVREDGWTLYGFDTPGERTVFQRLLGASGLGPKLALGILSALGPQRTVRAITTKDIAMLSTVSGIGKKRAEKLAVELSDRFADLPHLASPAEAARAAPADAAVLALGKLGYAPAAADEAVRAALADGAADETPALVRRALQLLTTSRGGRG